MSRVDRGKAAAVAGLAVVVILLASACTAPVGPPDAGAVQPTALPQAGAGPHEKVPSALRDMNDSAFPPPLIEPDDIVSGGPPPDGIPAIDEPTFIRAADVDWLDGAEPVLLLTLAGETRGYPVQIMTWHEIVNDTVGGVPVAVTYCPLCNSGVAFERQVGGRLLSFGTSGRLYADNLVMYDRQTESLWPQLTFTAAVGVLTGTKLTPHPLQAVSWDEFRAAHPGAWVLSRDTGFTRDYGHNPYVGYDNPDSRPLFPVPDADHRERLKERALVVAAWAVTARWSAGVPLRRGHAAWYVAGGVAGTLAATTALALTGRLTDPDVLGGSAALAETLIVAMVAAPLTYWATTRGRTTHAGPLREKHTHD